ncbi:phosphoglycolate phosphatase [Ruminococcaceae bacterium YRB3002]|nr:phosphoglycolate phosphatase [Ruminococcaceae bacterium YRB3002]
MRYKLVIFDLDGTLLATGNDICRAVNRALESGGIPPITMEQLLSYVGDGSLKLIERAMGASGFTSPDLVAKVHSDYRQTYLDMCCDTTVPFPGIVELLGCLRESGVKTAVNTNKPETASLKVIAHCLPGMVDLIVAQSDTVPRKPDPYGALKCISHFGFDASECCYVGDSDVDIMTASNAGIDCISVDWGFKTHSFLESHDASVIVSTCDELKGKI